MTTRTQAADSRAAAEAVDSRMIPLSLILGVACSSPRVLPPTPSKWLTDSVHYLDPKVASALDNRLEAYEKRTRHQFFVWITDSTRGEPTHQFTLRTFNAWGIGRERYDDGVLLFIFVKDDMRWITVGYGLEGAISDQEGTRICREVIAPPMRAGRHEEALASGIEAVIDLVDRWDVRQSDRGSF